MITTNIKNYIIIFRNWTQISITKAQYNLYRDEIEMKKHNDFITINDIDTNEILFEWRCNEIKEFKERKQDPSLYGAVYICDFWTRHSVSEWWECNCWKDFDCIWITFKDKLKTMWYKINYNSDITREMILQYKQQMS